MTDDNKKKLYGAARINRIKKIEHDVIKECLPLMTQTVVPVVMITEDGELTTWADPIEVILEKLALAAYDVERLEAGKPA